VAVAKLQALSAPAVRGLGELKGCGQTWRASAVAGRGGGVRGGDGLFLGQGVLQSPLVYSLLQMRQKEASLALFFGRRESNPVRNARTVTSGCFICAWVSR